MPRIRLIIILSLLPVSFSYGADNYKIGDQLYIWAISGLNLRTGPGTTFPVIKGIPFGEKVEVVEKSSQTYTFTLISSNDQNGTSTNIDPINLKGNWVKIKIDTTIGYVIDQYLLVLSPAIINKKMDYDLYFNITSIDTTWINPEVENGNEPDYCVLAHHDSRITGSICFGGMESSKSYAVSGYTIEEVLVIFGGLGFINYDEFTIRKNWQEKIELHDGVICDWTIQTKDNKVYVYMECSC